MDDGQLWKDISGKVQKDADRLFKMIGEAYAVLSDSDKVCSLFYVKLVSLFSVF